MNNKVKASYAASVLWIAINDQASIMDASAIARLPSVGLASALFNKAPLETALDVIKERARLQASESTKTIAAPDATAQGLPSNGATNHVAQA